MNKFLLLLFFCLTTSCGNKQNNQSKLEARLDKLENENKELKESIAKSPVPQSPTIFNEDRNLKEKTFYVFVLLVVELDKDVYSNLDPAQRTFNYCSGIAKLDEMDDEIKYKLLDGVQTYYFNTEGTSHPGSLKSREFFTFPSYAEASLAREQYVVSK